MYLQKKRSCFQSIAQVNGALGLFALMTVVHLFDRFEAFSFKQVTSFPDFTLSSLSPKNPSVSGILHHPRSLSFE